MNSTGPKIASPVSSRGKLATIVLSPAEAERQRRLRSELKVAARDKNLKKVAELSRRLNAELSWKLSQVPLTTGAESIECNAVTPRSTKRMLKKVAGAMTCNADNIKQSKKKKQMVDPKDESKRREKELLREIDASNFPPGTRLTSNWTGRNDQGGGFMSNRRKH